MFEDRLKAVRIAASAVRANPADSLRYEQSEVNHV